MGSPNSTESVDAIDDHESDAAAFATEEQLELARVESRDIDLSWIDPPPETDGWALAPDALRFLVSVIRRLRPRHILEFGSGLSTEVIATTCREASIDTRITSVDHDPEFGVLAERAFWERRKGENDRDRITFQIAPLVIRDCGGKLVPFLLWDASKFASQEPVDLVVIDGPPSLLGGREGTLYQALEYLRPGAVVLLDDASRQHEQQIVESWKQNLGDALSVRQLPGFTKGMATAIVKRPIPRSALWDHRIRLTKQEIAKCVAPDSTFILVDEGWWGQALSGAAHAVPLLGVDGEYWGAPSDDETAVNELQRLRDAGAVAICFVWPAFWWLEHYSGLRALLDAQFRRVVNNERLVVFDLQRARVA